MQIERSIVEAGLSYHDYYKIVEQLVAENKTSGSEQTVSLIDYTSLNLSRMKRLNKTYHPSEASIASLKDREYDLIWLVLTEAWCGDAAQIIPIIHKISELANGLDLKLLWRDEHPELMDQFLTNGSKSIPKLIAVDKGNLEVKYSWGPRPEIAQQMMLENKKTPDPDFKKNLHLWYAKDKGNSTEKEFLDLLLKKS